jgi:hypothetical protein
LGDESGAGAGNEAGNDGLGDGGVPDCSGATLGLCVGLGDGIGDGLGDGMGEALGDGMGDGLGEGLDEDCGCYCGCCLLFHVELFVVLSRSRVRYGRSQDRLKRTTAWACGITRLFPILEPFFPSMLRVPVCCLSQLTARFWGG